MTKLPFTVSARTARLIGRENVSHAEGAIIELVKNSYDADADFALVLINPSKKSIVIYDNGAGMTEGDIKNHWMMIGTDNKEKAFKSGKGRIKAGAKGIGRFALDRLGQKATMYTIAKGKESGHKWTANWNDFERSTAHIGQVYAELEDQPNLDLFDKLKNETGSNNIIKALAKYSKKAGTLLKIDFARDDWNEDLSQKIFKSLEILTPPEGQAKFDIYLFNEELKTLFGKIENESFNDYDYKLIATYKKNAARELNIKFYRNEFDFTQIDPEFFTREEMKEFPFDKRTFKKSEFILNLSIYDLIPGFREKEKKKISGTIGDFVFTYYFFKLGSSTEDVEKLKLKTFNLSVRKKWAAKFGGIKLFRDNFRVRPYGEVDTASYDWLMLGERKATSPAGVTRSGDYRVSPYQVAGTVGFSRVSKLFLDDKSGREGLIENDTFSLFKNILIGIIRLQENDRSTIAFNLNEYFNETHPEEINESEAVNISEQPDDETSEEDAKQQNKKLKKGIRSQKKKIEEREEELIMSRAMASAGILIASFSHEFHYIKNRLNNRTTNLRNVLLPLIAETRFKNAENRKNPYHLINEIKKIDEKIKQWLEFSINLTRKDRRRSKKINLQEYFTEFKKTWKRKLDDRGIALNFSSSEKQSEFHIKMIELDVDTIFDNLLANSIEAFQRDGFKGNRIIDIALARDSEYIDIEYKDSGPGLSNDIKRPNDIFKAFITTKVDNTGNEIGTGLGMWLLKSAVDYHKGEVKIFQPENGFQIRIKLKAHNHGRSAV
jgi:signal transduction histidine kinase